MVILHFLFCSMVYNVSLLHYDIGIDFILLTCLYIVAEELHNSELEKSCQAVKIQTLEGICFAWLWPILSYTLILWPILSYTLIYIVCTCCTSVNIFY